MKNQPPRAVSVTFRSVEARWFPLRSLDWQPVFIEDGLGIIRQALREGSHGAVSIGKYALSGVTLESTSGFILLRAKCRGPGMTPDMKI